MTPEEEEKMRHLRRLRREHGAREAEMKEIQGQVLPRLLEEGVVYLLDDDGSKFFAAPVSPETVYVDLEVIEAEVPDVVDEIVEKKVNNEAFKRAAAAGRIPPHVVRKAATIRQRSSYVKFGEPEA